MIFLYKVVLIEKPTKLTSIVTIKTKLDEHID
jgi:hypothetical protein